MFARLAAAVASLALFPALAQLSTEVSGSLSGSTAAGGSFVMGFNCTGEPVCVGVYQGTRTLDGCTNGLLVRGAIRITGMDLTRQGLMTPVANLTGFGIDAIRNNGVCSINFRSDEVMPLVGNWNGAGGSVSVQRIETDRFGRATVGTIGGTYSPSRPAPPLPVFAEGVQGSITLQTATVQSSIQFRPQDVGTNPSIYVFALAPENSIGKALRAKDPLVLGKAMVSGSADPVPCVLAQLNASGQLAGVSASTLFPALNATVTAQGATVTLLNNIASANVAGATFFVGYGSSGQSMLANGVNRSVATVPGQVICQPQPPTTGWWWNPKEDGRGFSVEVREHNLFFAGFLYDVSGRSAWYVASGPVSLDGAYFTGTLYSATGGQTLGGAYPGRPQLAEAGSIVLAFNDNTRGTMVWPGGVVPLQRFDIVIGGSADPGIFGHPENGWWWNPDESGRGFFLEWQGGTLDMASYMYDDQGNNVWYLAWGEMTETGGNTFVGRWWSYADGQTLTGPWKQNRRINDNVAPVTVTFTSPTTAVMTLPNGRTTNLQRHRF